MIVKIFNRSSYKNIQDQINQWLEENKDINIMNILQTSNDDELIVSIWYAKYKSKTEDIFVKKEAYEKILQELEGQN